MKKLCTALFILLAHFTYAQKTYIQCGKLIDGMAKTAQSQMTIVIEGGKITGVEKGYVSGSSTDKVINLQNKTVMPGLIDCHVHLESQGSKSSMLDGFRLTDADIAYQASV